MAPSPTSVTLKVKVPPGYIEDGHDEFALGSVEVSSTIGAIRQQIQTIVPSHPVPERQRILYGGRALIDNEQTLADALNTKRDPTQTEYVVHLLVKGEGQTSTAGSGAGAGAGQGHRRVASTPTPTNVPGQQQPQVQPQLQPHVPGLPAVQGLQQGHYGQHTHALLQQQHQQNITRHLQMQQQQMIQQQQLMAAQMAQRQGMNGGPENLQAHGLPMPPGIPILQQQQRPIPPGFAQAVAQGQQQRAAMGMQGVGPQAPREGQEVNGQAQTPQSQVPSQQQPATDGQQPAQATDTQQSQTPTTNGLPRPISGQGFHFEGTMPGGQRVQIHQQTLQFPHVVGGNPGGAPFGFPNMPAVPQIPHFPPQGNLPSLFPNPQQHQPQFPPSAAPSALDRARDNITEMRRLLDEMRDAEGATEEQRARITSLQERAQSVGEYVDPFGVRGANGGLFGNTGAGQRSASPNAQAAGSTPAAGNGGGSLFGRTGPPFAPPASLFGSAGQQSLFGSTGQQSLFGSSQPRFGNGAFVSALPSNPADATCYLLSGPQGPSALLFSPQHGTYTGQFATNNSALRPTPTTPAASQQQQQNPGQQILNRLGQQPQAAPAAAGDNQIAAQQPGQENPVPQNANANAAQQPDPLGPFAPIMNHIWLLLRVLIFAYFLLGSNLGWRRPAALLVIGAGFWMVRAGLFGEGGVARRWWEGVVDVGPRGQQGVQGGGEPQQGAQDGAAGGAGDAGGEGARQAGMPTPEQVAQRLLGQQRGGQQNARVQQLRELVRPVERAVALFVASLWPGIGEAHVRAREEAEAEARRREGEAAAEAERVRREEEEVKARDEGQRGQGEKKEGEGGVVEGEKGEKSMDGGKEDGLMEGRSKDVAESQGGAGAPRSVSEPQERAAETVAAE